MLKLIKTTLYVFIVIVALTALLVLGGLASLWFLPSMATRSDLPYLGALVTALLLEVIAVVLTLVRKGFKYLPHVENHHAEETDPNLEDAYIYYMQSIGYDMNMETGENLWEN